MSKFLLFWFMALSTGVFAQGVLRGVIYDQDEQPVVNVRIQEVGTKNWAYTDMEGQFGLEFFTTENPLAFSHPSYDSLVLKFDPERKLIVFLNRKIGDNAYNTGGMVGYTDFEHKVVNKNLDVMPYFLGQADINRQLQMLPGIEHGREGFSNLFVRGGDFDQNLMLYNGTPIYNFNHLYGITSVFHNRSIQNTRVFKGISPARYGGRSSSVMALESHKNAEFSDLKGEIEMSPLTGGIYIENINKNKNYFTIAARRTWLDLLFPVEVRQNDFNFNFYDIQTNFGFKSFNGDAWDFSIMNTRDLYFLSAVVEPDSNNAQYAKYSLLQKWRNVLASAKHTRNYSPRFVGVNSVHYSHYGSEIKLQEEILLNDRFDPNPISAYTTNRGIQDIIFRSDWNYKRNTANVLNFGLQSNTRLFLVIRETFSSENYPGQADNIEIEGDASYQPSFEESIYAENIFQRNAYFKARYGGRVTAYMNGEFFYPAVEPRIHMTYRPDSSSALKFGYNRHHQFVNQLHAGESGSIRNLWVPATENIRPQVSDIVEVGYERSLDRVYSLGVNAYYKTIQNLSTIANLDDAEDPNVSWENSVYQGSGKAYGVELMLQKNEGYFTGWMSYVFSRSTRNFPGLFDDDFLFSHDRTHMFKMYGNVTIYDEWKLGFNYLVGSGSLFTIPIGKYYDQAGQLQLEYNTLNNYRSPMYHRFDLSLIRVKDLVGWEQEWKFYVYNLIGSRNPLNITADFADASLTDITVQRSFLAFVPGIAYLLKF